MVITLDASSCLPSASTAFYIKPSLVNLPSQAFFSLIVREPNIGHPVNTHHMGPLVFIYSFHGPVDVWTKETCYLSTFDPGVFL